MDKRQFIQEYVLMQRGIYDNKIKLRRNIILHWVVMAENTWDLLDGAGYGSGETPVLDRKEDYKLWEEMDDKAGK